MLINTFVYQCLMQLILADPGSGRESDGLFSSANPEHRPSSRTTDRSFAMGEPIAVGHAQWGNPRRDRRKVGQRAEPGDDETASSREPQARASRALPVNGLAGDTAQQPGAPGSHATLGSPARSSKIAVLPGTIPRSQGTVFGQEVLLASTVATGRGAAARAAVKLVGALSPREVTPG